MTTDDLRKIREPRICVTRGGDMKTWLAVFPSGQMMAIEGSLKSGWQNGRVWISGVTTVTPKPPGNPTNTASVPATAVILDWTDEADIRTVYYPGLEPITKDEDIAELAEHPDWGVGAAVAVLRDRGVLISAHQGNEIVNGAHRLLRLTAKGRSRNLVR